MPSHPEPVPVFVEEESPRGTYLTQDLLDRVAKIFISRLGYDSHVETPPVIPESRLSSTNEAMGDATTPLLPVDAQCQARMEQLAERRTWSAFPAVQEKLFRVPESLVGHPVPHTFGFW